MDVRCLKQIDSSVERAVGKHWPGTGTMVMQLVGWCGCTASGSVVGDVAWKLFAAVERYRRLLGPGSFRDLRMMCTVAFLSSHLEEKFLRRGHEIGLDITFLARMDAKSAEGFQVLFHGARS